MFRDQFMISHFYEVLHNDSEFNQELRAAGNRLVVVDFSATW